MHTIISIFACLHVKVVKENAVTRLIGLAVHALTPVLLLYHFLLFAHQFFLDAAACRVVAQEYFDCVRLRLLLLDRAVPQLESGALDSRAHVVQNYESFFIAEVRSLLPFQGLDCILLTNEMS